jgi:hypothetical protein
MKFPAVHINLVAAWIGILLGFASGFLLGTSFHQEDWLGGYGSFRRRLYRLAHISCFGLGAVNLLFYLTAQKLPAGVLLGWASASFLLGAITMPLCCLIMAHMPKARLLFAIPVFSLLTGGVLTLLEVLKV